MTAPLTRLNPNLLFAYMKAPDNALVEINTASTRAFLHVHLVSAAPLCAADWYIKHLGAKGLPAPAYVMPGDTVATPYFELTPKNLPMQAAK